jgi:hypothetical protein
METYKDFLIKLYSAKVKNKELYLKVNKLNVLDNDFIEKKSEIEVYKSVIKDLKQWKQ